MPLLAFRQPYEGSFPVPVKPCGDVKISPLRSYADQFGALPAPFQRSDDMDSTTGGAGTEGTVGSFQNATGKSSKGEAVLYLTSPNLNIPNAESSDEVGILLYV